jgi:hypothetical protein
VALLKLEQRGVISLPAPLVCAALADRGVPSHAEKRVSHPEAATHYAPAPGELPSIDMVVAWRLVHVMDGDAGPGGGHGQPVDVSMIVRMEKKMQCRARPGAARLGIVRVLLAFRRSVQRGCQGVWLTVSVPLRQGARCVAEGSSCS